MDYTWEDMAGSALARQFPEDGLQLRTRTAADVVDLLARVGPVQAQTARSPFIGVAARLPGVTLDLVSAAYEGHQIVRGSNIRGTVHTSTPADNTLLEALTRIGQRTLWARYMGLSGRTLEELWSGLEEYAAEEWRTPAELAEYLQFWIAQNDPDAKPRLDTQPGRYFGFGHGGLLRRPLKGGWQGQGAPGYRTAAAVLTDAPARRALFENPDVVMDAAVRRHLGAHGPASRKDIAWWSGVGLRLIDAALERLAPQLREGTGPDGLVYYDLAQGTPPPRAVQGVRLLPEFDALLCGYDPPARERFVDAGHYARLWNQDNGMILAPLMVDGRLTGWWRMVGSGTRKSLQVTWFSRTRRPRKGELAAPIAALETAFGVQVTELALTRE